MFFAQNVNLLAYILSCFFRCGILSGNILHSIDCTELYNDTARSLFTTTIRNKKIRVCQGLDCDCGTRRKKPAGNKTLLSQNLTKSYRVIEKTTCNYSPNKYFHVSYNYFSTPFINLQHFLSSKIIFKHILLAVDIAEGNQSRLAF